MIAFSTWEQPTNSDNTQTPSEPRCDFVKTYSNGRRLSPSRIAVLSSTSEIEKSANRSFTVHCPFASSAPTSQ